jgi:hypothetical protein
MAAGSHRTKTKKPRLPEEHWQEGPEGQEQIYEPEWRQLQEAEEHCRLQREELERIEARGELDFHFHAHSHPNSLKTNSHIWGDPNKIMSDEADLEYITSILESFANLETTSA